MKNRYDLAVLDVKIPKMSGIHLKKEIEAIQPSMRFIFMTGHGSEKDFQEGAAEAGAGILPCEARQDRGAHGKDERNIREREAEAMKEDEETHGAAGGFNSSEK